MPWLLTLTTKEVRSKWVPSPTHDNVTILKNSRININTEFNKMFKNEKNIGKYDSL